MCTTHEGNLSHENQCTHMLAGTHRDHQRAWDPVTGGCELLCECRTPNSGPLLEQPMLLVAESSHDPMCSSKFHFISCLQMIQRDVYALQIPTSFPSIPGLGRWAMRKQR